MIDFTKPDYLNYGNTKQKEVFQLLRSSKVFHTLADFNPVLAGTIPIEVDTDESDLDIICYWEEPTDFISAILFFENELDFKLASKIINGYKTIIANFKIGKFQMEIFGQNRPVQQQEAYRHMLIEYKILAREGNSFRSQVVTLKKAGYNTEAAFAHLLNLHEEPFSAILNYKI